MSSGLRRLPELLAKISSHLTIRPMRGEAPSGAFPKFESFRFVATINDNRHSGARSAARASYDVQLHIRESITTAGAMDSGPALRPAIAGPSTSRNDERWITSHGIGFMESLN